MKNYNNEELILLESKIASNIKFLDLSISWASNNLKYDEQKDLILSLKNSKNVFHKINQNIFNKPAIALFGASQVGKSYLIKNLLSIEGKPFLIENNKVKYDFLKDINPQGGGSESTGVVTRFTKENNVIFSDFPIKVKLLTPKDVLLIICDSFFLDSKKIIGYPIDLDFEILLKKLESKPSSINQNTLTEFDILDCKDYFDQHFSKYTLALDGLFKTRFFERIGKIIHNYNFSEWSDIFSVLWKENGFLTNLFNDLIHQLNKVGFDNNVYLSFDSVLREGVEILNVERLKELNKNQKEIIVKRENNDEISFEVCFVSALISELVFQIPNEIIASKEFMNNSDLLDFPGARSRLAIDVDEITTDSISDLLLRGKVSYLFNKYSDESNINNLLFCTNDSQLEVNELPSILFNWIQKNIGGNELERSEAIGNSEVDPLFVIFTFFNEQLKFDSTNDYLFSEQNILDYKWKKRFNTFFEEGIVTQNKKWHKKWSKEKELYNNFYLLRDYKYSTDTFFDFENSLTEKSIQSNRIDYYNSLKKSFLNFDFVKNHFNNPEYVWDKSASINNDGTYLITQNLNKVSNNFSKINNYLNRISQESEKIEIELKKHIHIDDLSKLRIKSMKKVSDFQFSFNSIFAMDEFNFIKLLNAFYIKPIDVYNLLNENIFKNINSINQEISIESKILISQIPELENVFEKDEIMKILQKNLYLDTIEEVGNFLKEKSISIEQITRSKETKSISKVFVDLIYEMWIKECKIKTSELDLNLSAQHYEFLLTHYTKIYFSKDFEKQIQKIFSATIKELESNRGFEEFLSESVALIFNDLINNFDSNQLTIEEIEEFQSVKNSFNIDSSYLNIKEVVINNQELEKIFSSIIDNKIELPLIRYNSWINKLKISSLISCGFVDYDEVANNQLSSIIESFKNVNFKITI